MELNTRKTIRIGNKEIFERSRHKLIWLGTQWAYPFPLAHLWAKQLADSIVLNISNKEDYRYNSIEREKNCDLALFRNYTALHNICVKTVYNIYYFVAGNFFICVDGIWSDLIKQ
ncbi:hypothetical protein HZS_2476 [Henneguya salminicola]|nr:hypothetical protein HZS_2476 [Henneguya salminicola]